jgi:hypothetical protein
MKRHGKLEAFIVPNIFIQGTECGSMELKGRLFLSRKKGSNHGKKSEKSKN